MMLILKLPILYLAGVCYWAIKAELKPLEAARVTAPLDPGPWSPFRRRPRRPTSLTAGRAVVRQGLRVQPRWGCRIEHRAVRGRPCERGRDRSWLSGCHLIDGERDRVDLYRPVRLAPFALLVAFIAAALAKTTTESLQPLRRRRRRSRLVGHGHRSHLEQTHSPRWPGPGGHRGGRTNATSVRDVDGLNVGHAQSLLEQYLLENPEAVPEEANALRER